MLMVYDDGDGDDGKSFLCDPQMERGSTPHPELHRLSRACIVRACKLVLGLKWSLIQMDLGLARAVCE
jgi:hypothetical protein